MKFSNALLVLISIIAFYQCQNSTNDIVMDKPFDPYDTIPIVSDNIKTVGIYSDQGAHSSCITAAVQMFQFAGYQTKMLYKSHINNCDIADIDLFYFPGGSSGPYRDNLTQEGKNYIRNMIKRGCGFIGTCAGALFACEIEIWQNSSYMSSQLGIVPIVGMGPNTEIFSYPSFGMCKLNISQDHPVTQDIEDTAWILYYNGPYFELSENNSNVKVLATFDITGGPAIVAYTYGVGRIVLTSPHPEWEEDSSRDHVSYFDYLNDYGSDWPLMKSATDWIFENINY
jgi:glutamine amidotransferase-like uncharacterized protein